MQIEFDFEQLVFDFMYEQERDEHREQGRQAEIGEHRVDERTDRLGVVGVVGSRVRKPRALSVVRGQ